MREYQTESIMTALNASFQSADLFLRRMFRLNGVSQLECFVHA
jgi:hypothetical protein